MLFEATLDSIITFEIMLFITLNSIWLFLYHGFKNKRYKQWDKTPPVSIIIPAYNKASLIRKTILSSLSTDYPEKEVIVVDDGSDDGTGEICSRFAKKKKIRLITHSRNLGKAAALNTGVKAARNGIIVTVDADSFPKKDSLRKLVKYFADPKIGAVAGTIKVAKSKAVLTVYQSLEYISQGFQRLCQGFIDAIMVAPGPLTAYRKDALVKAGYFESDTVVEDFDMTIKIHKAGYSVASEKKAEAFTIAPNTLKQWKAQRVRWARGGIQIFKKHFDVMTNKNTRPLAMFSFPMLMMWTGLPYLILCSYILVAIRSITAVIQNFNPNILMNILLLLQKRNVYNMYVEMERYLTIFFNLNNLNLTIMLGYISVFIFLIYTVFSFKTVKENFQPNDLKGLALITVYWFMLIFVHIYASFLEIFNRKRSW